MLIAGIVLAVIFGVIAGAALMDCCTRTEVDSADEAICQLYNDGRIDLETAERLSVENIARHTA